MAKEIRFHNHARQSLLAGINAVADLVGSTLGPHGQTVLLDQQIGPGKITKDGVTVARHVRLADRWEDEGAKLIQETAQRTDTEAGDGTTASTILCRALYREGIRQINRGADPQALERGIHLAVSRVISCIATISTPIRHTDRNAVYNIAHIATNGDVELANVIADAIHHAGPKGVYRIDDAEAPVTALVTPLGYEFQRGLLKPNFMNAPGSAQFANAKVFVTNRTLIDRDQFARLLDVYCKAGFQHIPLLIICRDCEGAALQIALVNNANKQLTLAIVKAPGSGNSQEEEVEDIAAFTGARAFLNSEGSDFSKATADDFGLADEVSVLGIEGLGPGKTIIIGGGGAKLAIDARVDDLSCRLADPKTTPFQRTLLENRLAALTAAVAVVKIGSSVASKLFERRDRAVDGISSCRAALAEGVVPGGGVALLRTLPSLNNLITTMSGDERIGAEIVRSALSAPLRQLAFNAGSEALSAVLGTLPLPASQRLRLAAERYLRHRQGLRLRSDWKIDALVDYVLSLPGGYGYNALSNRIENLPKAGIIDPAKVVRLALQNAAELTGLLLTLAGGAVQIPEPQPPAAPVPNARFQ